MVPLLCLYLALGETPPAPEQKPFPFPPVIGDIKTGEILLPARVPPPPQLAVAALTPRGEIAIFWDGPDLSVEGVSFLLKQFSKKDPDRLPEYLQSAKKEGRPVWTQTWKLDAKDVQVYTAGGNKVDARLLPKALKGWTPVLLSTNGEPVDLVYRQLLKEGTLILVFPRGKLQPGLPKLDPDPPPF